VRRAGTEQSRDLAQGRSAYVAGYGSTEEPEEQDEAVMTRETVPMNAEALNTQFLEALNLDSWTEERVVVDEDEITRRMEVRGKLLASMMVWLDKQ
jgi:hypothetical protein